ncbi:Mu-transpos_C domain-containing protein [Paraburkholderia caribensis]|uniref:transcriptional antiterminator n=1 Tax=Paraburkholderia caribensis TaxID=75105 RepID=UPI001CB647F1|nr:transcriptional antiterminator [Paraburkholderia caribensis]CAG9219233.1 Mu-transpos_C domain-containing protein [Paraburkholderia caribensis]
MGPTAQPLASPTPLIPNDVFADDKGTYFRLLRVCDDGNAWIINISDKSAWPRHCLYSDLVNARKVSIGACRELPFCSASTAERRKSAFQAIAPLISDSSIYEAVYRGPLVTARAKQTGLSKTTINRYLRMYWTGGQTQNALCFEFSQIGKVPALHTNGRGNRTERFNTYQIKKDDIEHINKSITEFYFHKKTRTLRATYDRMLDKYYSYVDGNGDSFIKPLGERPTLRQFIYVFKHSFSLEERLRHREGEKEFNRVHNHHLSGALYDGVGAGQVFEIDATIDDVWLGAKDDRSTIIGKATKYLIYDRYSRLCVGWYVGLENACWESAMQAILSIAEDKSELCRKYDIPYDPSDYPAHGVFPQKWVADCGEMISRNSNRICSGMEGTLSNASPLCPQTKGTVECGFKTMHVKIASITPGYDPPSNATRRRGKHYDKDACLTLDEYTSIILLAIIEHNRHMMKNYPVRPDVIMRARPIPIELWNDNVINQVGNLWRYSEDYLHLKLLPMSSGTVTDEGIFFEGCYYSCRDLEKKGWFISAAHSGRSTVSLSFDRRLVDAVIVYDPNNPNLAYRCELTPRSMHFKGYSFMEVQYIIRTTKAIIKGNEEDEQQRRSDFAKRVSAIAEPAYEEMKAVTRGKSRNARKTDAAATRQAEKAERRKTEALIPLDIFNGATDESSRETPTLHANVVAMPPGYDATDHLSNSRAQGGVRTDGTDESAARPLDASAISDAKSLEERLAARRQEMLNGLPR